MKPISLSDNEWKLMEHLWDNSPRTIMQLTRALAEQTGWAKATIITMLSRLEAKGAVRWQSGGRARQYYPTISREAASAAETRSFLDKVYHGSVGLLVNAMANENALSADEIDELYAILREAGKGGAT
mgnify:CR=1 FL=1